jgi:hypothetical protein
MALDGTYSQYLNEIRRVTKWNVVKLDFVERYLVTPLSSLTLLSSLTFTLTFIKLILLM